MTDPGPVNPPPYGAVARGADHETMQEMVAAEAARECRRFYDALMGEDFSDDQAIRLIGVIMGGRNVSPGTD